MLKIPDRRITTQVTMCVLAMVAACIFTLVGYGLQTQVPPGFTVDGWNAGGSSLAQLQQQMTTNKQRLLLQPIQLASSQPDVPVPAILTTMEQLGLQVLLEGVLNPIAQLQTGSPFARAVKRWQLRNQQYAIRYEIDASKLHALLIKQFPALYEQQPVNAQRIIGPTDTVSYVPESHVMRIDEAGLLQRLKETAASLSVRRDKDEGWDGGWDGDRNSGDTRSKARPLSTGIDNGQAGNVGKQLLEKEHPLDISLPLVKVEAALTIQMLQAQGVERKISEFTTTLLQNSEGRLHNVRSTAAAIHDLLMKPGDVFDYAVYIAQTEAKFGFKEAPVILNGKLVPGIGGGICQVSSTLYNAVLRAGLSIVERRNHSLPVSYVPLGQDATFAAGQINFQFRNSTDKYLLIRTLADDRQMTVKLFGYMPPDITYSIESTTIRTLQPEVKYVANPSLPLGKQRPVTEGKLGYVVDTFRYKKQNGQLVGQERISQDTYAAQPTVIAIHPSTDTGTGPGGGLLDSNPEGAPGKTYQPPLIEDGIKGPLFR
jgi:hypothetical protein